MSDPKREAAAEAAVSQAIQETIEAFKGKYVGFKMMQQEHDPTMLTVHFSGDDKTRENEQEIYDALMEHLDARGFKLEAKGGPGGFEGSYGDEDYEQAESYNVIPK